MGIDGYRRLLYCLRLTFGVSAVAGEYPQQPLWKLKNSQRRIPRLAKRRFAQAAAAARRHRRRDLAVRRRPRLPGGLVPLDRGHSPLSFVHRRRSPARPRRAFRARLVQRLGGEGQRASPPPARAARRACRSCASSARSAAATPTGSSTRSTPTPASARWRGSTTRSMRPATTGRGARAGADAARRDRARARAHDAGAGSCCWRGRRSCRPA